MKNYFFASDNSMSGFITRIAAGLVLLPHGLQKALGMFGGYGFGGTMGYFTETLHLPYIVALLVIILESVGAICMIIGFATRFWSAALVVLFIGMIVFAHQGNGFFMNWYGTQAGEGFEYHLLFIGLCLASYFSGGGKWSMDNKMIENNA
jgi:putative oxidoreductase